MACSEADYDYLREVVQAEAAIVVEPGRNAQFEQRLGPLARKAGGHHLEDLVGLLRTEGGTPLRRAVAEAMTINETSFFRDGSPFDVIRGVILPELIERNRTTRRLRLWSAAGSTGQEAYSLAMLLCDAFPEVAATWDVEILATDISRPAIEYARAARYRRLEVNRGLPARMLLKYLVRDGDEWQVADQVRRLCRFEDMNLCAASSNLPRFDLVLLRNVLLYFSQQDRAAVFTMVHRQMTGGGYLLLGAAEQAEDSTDLFRVEFAQDCYFYRPVAMS
ncbi:MAG: protein-glutamate O-methyltransferase CheR [Acidobacteriota bacterium]|nr:protein-glutamate O-methyltransferase CheR [Acidobacteriota bacterium]